MTTEVVHELLAGVDVEQLHEAFALALPWLKAVTAGALLAALPAEELRSAPQVVMGVYAMLLAEAAETSQSKQEAITGRLEELAAAEKVAANVAPIVGDLQSRQSAGRLTHSPQPSTARWPPRLSPANTPSPARQAITETRRCSEASDGGSSWFSLAHSAMSGRPDTHVLCRSATFLMTL